MLEFVKITAEYSNAVLVAILPYVSDFGQKLDLPISLPVTTAQVAKFAPDPRRDHIGGSLVLTNGFGFIFEYGHIAGFSTPKSFSRVQDPSRIPDFYGPVNMDENAAVALARNTLLKFKGTYVPELVREEPTVIPPLSFGTNYVPRYDIRWIMPGQKWPWIEVEVDASTKTIQNLLLLATNFWREGPKISVIPQVAPPPNPNPPSGTPLTPVSQAYSNALLGTVLPQATEFARRLQLPIALPIAPQMVGHVEVGLLQGTPLMYIELTNRFRFLYEHGYVSLFRSPDCFFGPSFERKEKYEDFVGPINMTEEEMIGIGREAVRKKLGYSEGELPLTEPAHATGGPDKGAKVAMARFNFQWDERTDDEPYPPPIVGFEIDASTGTLKSLYINHTNLWRNAPDLGTSP